MFEVQVIGRSDHDHIQIMLRQHLCWAIIADRRCVQWLEHRHTHIIGVCDGHPFNALIGCGKAPNQMCEPVAKADNAILHAVTFWWIAAFKAATFPASVMRWVALIPMRPTAPLAAISVPQEEWIA